MVVAAKGVLLTVEDEAKIGVDPEATATEARAYVINYGVALNDLCLTAVEVRIAATVPEVNVLDIEYYLLIGGLDLLKLVFFLIVDGVNDLLTVSELGGINLNLDLCILANDLGCDLDAGGAVVVEIKVGVCYADDIYVSVKTAIEGEVRHLGINSLVRRVINRDSKERLVCEAIGEIDSPCGITAVVVSELLAVEIYVSRGVCTSDLEVILRSYGKLCTNYLLRVDPCTAEVIVSAVLSVGRIPGVGEINYLPLGGERRGELCGLCEGPFLIEIYYISHILILSFPQNDVRQFIAIGRRHIKH